MKLLKRHTFLGPLSNSSLDIILDIRPDNILCTLNYTRALMQQRTLRFTVRKHCNAPHNRLDRVCVDNAFFDARYEEGRFTTTEVVVEIDEESEERRLASIGR